MNFSFCNIYNEFSKEMVGYPAEQDYEFYTYYQDQKKQWLSELNYKELKYNIIYHNLKIRL